MVNICENSKCTGCMACYNACPKHCISMEYDQYGTLLPKINEAYCINCQICSKVCPSNKDIENNYPLEAYACWNLDEEARKSSSSGGIAHIFYKNFIEQNGIVYGCHYDENLQLKFSSASIFNEIEKYKTSKYSQAYIGNTFQEIRNFLDNKKKVLFIGTPCQVAGLKNFLRKNYDNLVTIDLICHGVPSQKYINEYVKSLDLQESPTSLSFRGLHDFYFTLYKESQILYSKKAKEDPYFYSFLKGLFYRESCYECLYAKPSRIGDITIGDFWGLGKKIPFEHDTNSGVSLALINTAKGKLLFEDIKNSIFFEKREVSEAIEGNDQLRHPSIKHKDFDKFQNLYLQDGFAHAIQSCFNK